MGERSRFRELVGLASYAASKDLVIIPTHQKTPDGELVELRIASLPHADAAKASVRRSITFGLARESARYREERPKSGHGRTAVIDDVPYDFGASYRIADVWKGRTAADDPTWEEFHDGEGLIDFLADRLTV